MPYHKGRLYRAKWFNRKYILLYPKRGLFIMYTKMCFLAKAWILINIEETKTSIFKSIKMWLIILHTNFLFNAPDIMYFSLTYFLFLCIDEMSYFIYNLSTRREAAKKSSSLNGWAIKRGGGDKGPGH